MSDELRQLATAIMALADSNRGIGAVLQSQADLQQSQIDTGRETNRMLGEISRQQAEIIERIEKSNERHAESSSRIAAVKKVVDNGEVERGRLKSTVHRHGERLSRVEEVLGIQPTEG